MQLPVGLRRVAYRCAHLLLRVYWFLRRPAVVGVKCLLTSGDRVLLVRHTYGPREWDLPGGSIHRREPPLTTARREMQEELGVDIDDWAPFGSLSAIAQHRRDTIHLFHADLPDPRLTIDRGELAVVRWFPRHELPAELGRYVRPILDLAAPRDDQPESG